MQFLTITLALLTTTLTTALPHQAASELIDPSSTLVQRADIPSCCTAALNAQSANGPNAAVEIKNAIDACNRAGCTSGSSSGSSNTGSAGGSYTPSVVNDTTTTGTGAGSYTGAGTNWQTAYEPTLWHQGCQPCPGNYGPKGCMCEDCGYMACKAAPGS